MKLVLSTLSAPQSVCLTQKAPNGALRIVKRIMLNGGANVIDRRTLLTPQGIITEVSDKDFDLLKETDFWKRQEKAGYLRVVETKDAAEDTKKAGMKKRDKSSQKTEQDFAESGAKPKTGKPSDDAE